MLRFRFRWCDWPVRSLAGWPTDGRRSGSEDESKFEFEKESEEFEKESEDRGGSQIQRRESESGVRKVGGGTEPELTSKAESEELHWNEPNKVAGRRRAEARWESDLGDSIRPEVGTEAEAGNLDWDGRVSWKSMEEEGEGRCCDTRAEKEEEKENEKGICVAWERGGAWRLAEGKGGRVATRRVGISTLARRVRRVAVEWLCKEKLRRVGASQAKLYGDVTVSVLRLVSGWVGVWMDDELNVNMEDEESNAKRTLERRVKGG
ncbi:hypothetical protein C8R43DRAFT_965304 [Mycena crocata]|nr:hypothetical protein C8R43DRAFT_965304 [Mycena crocata]